MRAKVVQEFEDGRSAKSDRPRPFLNDLDQTIRAVQALVATNNDIFNRIAVSMIRDSDHGTIFQRNGFERVKARQCQSTIRFTTHQECSEMAFNFSSLKVLPGSTLGVLQLIYRKDFRTFIDFESLLVRAVGVMHEDVLRPFLHAFKDHLESVQVCLGEVDQWLFDAERNKNFLETLFSSKLNVGGDTVDVYMSSTGGTHVPGTDRCLSNEVCVNCNCLFDWHQAIFINDYYYRRCINAPNMQTNGMCWFYSYQKDFVLEEFEVELVMNISQFEAVFNISQASEQTRLKSILEFLSF